ncbi:MAG: LuxR C-terminal-related transcriptional regulator [Terracidiphilus sp.]
MKRNILILGIVGGLLISLLRWSEYRFLVLEHSFEIYGALVAIVFASLGIWLGLRFARPHRKNLPQQLSASGPFTPDEKSRDALGITRRELEILELVAQGMSNREIAGKLFVSENTVKTHCSRTFDKLGARRRTQAVQRAKQLRLLP